jgi:hypothetical protein
MPFHRHARRFLEKAIRIRFYLIKTDCSNNPAAEHAARVLDMQLRTYPYAADDRMAGFIVRHENDIRDTIPGAGSRCGEKLNKEFNQLLAKAKQLMKDE